MRNPKKSMGVEGGHLICKDLETNEPKKRPNQATKQSLELFPACSLVAEKGKPRARSLNEVFTTSHDVQQPNLRLLSWQRERSRIRQHFKIGIFTTRLFPA